MNIYMNAIWIHFQNNRFEAFDTNLCEIEYSIIEITKGKNIDSKWNTTNQGKKMALMIEHVIFSMKSNNIENEFGHISKC